MQVYPTSHCVAFLKRQRVGVMALAKEGRAYAVPLFFAYDGERLFFMSHPGEKDAFIEACEEACFVVVQVEGEDEWISVQATGPVEKVTLSDDAMHALDLMAKNPFPPEFGTTPQGWPKHSAERMYIWALTPRKLFGRQSKPPASRAAR